ncbi:MAG TPA: rod-binding protein [Gaiellaceae bacterium]|jgi:Rod binding domain-containing protein
MSSSLPPIDSALLPADVRKDGAKGRELYQAALGFEQVLERQLAQALVSTTDSSDSDSDSDSDDTGSGVTDLYKQMLPDALSQGMAANGGLGLAPQLYESLKETSS